MRMLCRLAKCTKKISFYLVGDVPSLSKQCKFCMRDKSIGDIVRSAIFFDKPSINISLDFEPLTNFDIVEIPINVLEEAISLSDKHERLIDIPVRKLKKGIKKLLKEIIRISNEYPYRYIITTFQQNVIKKGTLSHPQFRIFAFWAPISISNVLDTCKKGEGIYENEKFKILLPFVRDYINDLYIFPKKESATLLMYLESLTDAFYHLIKLHGDDLYQGIIFFIVNKKKIDIYGRLTQAKVYPLPWPLSSFSLAGFRTVLGDPSDIELKIKEISTKNESDPFEE